jgi:hypothetical protein
MATAQIKTKQVSRCAREVDLDRFFNQRLPQKELLSVTDIASALNANAEAIRAWIDDGSIKAVNVSAGKKPIWRVFRASVLNHLKTRVA